MQLTIGLDKDLSDETVPLKTMDDNTGADTGEVQLYDKPEDEKILFAAYRSNIQELNTLMNDESESAWKSYHPTEDTLLHRIASGGYPLCLEATKLILDNWKDFGINSQNVKGWTALHNACYRSQQISLVELLLQRGADATISNSDGENPFQLIIKCNSPEAIKIADLLLSNNSKLIFSRSNTGENVVETILKHSAVNMLEFLWTKFNNASDATFNSLLVDSGREGPSMWLAVQKGDGPDTVRCVDFLLDILPAQAINAIGKDGNTSLHVAAKYCFTNIIKALVSNAKTNVFEPNKEGETCLHLLAQVSGLYANPLLGLQTLFGESQQLRNNEAAKRRLILSKNPFFNLSSPLMLAVKNKKTKVAQFLIQEHGDKEAIAKSNDLLADIYERTPEAAIPLLDKCITYIPSSSEDDLDTIKTDMGPITGFEGEDIRNESKLIHGIFNSPPNQQRCILSHPVVTIFLIEKWKRLQPLTYFYITLYAFWLLVYSILCYELYPPRCPNATDSVTSQIGITDLRIFRSLVFQKRLETEKCDFNSTLAKLFALILLCYTPVFVLQEAVKIIVTQCRWNTYLLNPATVLHWIRHLATIVNVIPAFMDQKSIPDWQYHVGMVLFALAWLMLLNDLANFRRIAIFYSILIVTVKNYAQFLACIGVPVLVAFVPALSRYVAKQNQFLYLPFGIVKNFMLMTGEVEYKETFYSDDGPNLTSNDIIGQFIIVICVFGFGFVLANVLTSVAVKDYQDLVRDAGYKTAVMQLKSINFVDALIVWLNGIPLTFAFGQFLAKRNQLEFDGITRTIKSMKTEKFSEELKQLVKDIAIRETASMNSDYKKSVKKAFG